MMTDNYLSYLLRSRLGFGLFLFYIVFIFAYYGLLITNLQSGANMQVMFSYKNLFLKIIICQFFMVLICTPLCVCKNFYRLEDQLKLFSFSASFLELSRTIINYFSACIILIVFSLFLSLPILLHAHTLYGVDFQELGLICIQIVAILIFILSITIFFNFYTNNTFSAILMSYFTVLFIGLGYLLIALSRTTISLQQGINYHSLFLILLGPFYKVITMISDGIQSYSFRVSYLSYLITYLILSVILICFSIKRAKSVLD